MKKVILLVFVMFTINTTLMAQAQQLDSLPFKEKIKLMPNKISNSDAPLLDVIYTGNNTTGYIIEKKNGNIWSFSTAGGQKDGTDVIDYDLSLDTLKANVYRITIFYLDGKTKVFYFRTKSYTIALR